MPLETLAPRRLYRQIADQLRQLIRAGEFPVGSRLPPERDLAAQLGVSRPSVREALIALEVEGLVEVRMGSGVFVLAGDRPAGAPRVETAHGPFEVIRARLLVEGELAAVAALRIGPAELQGLRSAQRQMQADLAAGRSPVGADRRFHLCLAQAADIGPLLRTVADLYDERGNPLFGRLTDHVESAVNWREALVEHQAVIDAIAAQDPVAARAAMHAHLQQSHDRLADHWPLAVAPGAASAGAPAGTLS